MIPGLRLQTTIAAGLFRVPRSLFLSSTALSAATWIVTCFSIGFVLRNKYEWLIDGITNPFLMAAIVLPLLAITAAFVLSRRKAITSKLKQSAGVAA